MRKTLAFLFAVSLAACAHTTPSLATATSGAVMAPDRDPEDQKLDAGRKPIEFLAFAGVKPGQKVAEIGAGGGYTTELLARSVGPTGTVYSQNSKMIVEKFADKPWTARLAKPVNKNVIRVEREFDDPLPEDAKDLDLVVIAYLYHDTVWFGTDRDKMNKAVFDHLKSGGSYIVADSSARAGSGLNDVKTLHRIEEKTVIDEVTKAGFKMSGEGDFLKNPNDARDWNSSPVAAGDKRGTSDRFVLRFVKP